MPAKIFSAATVGINALPIEVEVDVSPGIHAFHIIGLADKAIEESKERIGLCLKNSGLKSPLSLNKKVTVNLAPADFKKEGSGYDLAIAIGYLIASGQLFLQASDRTLFVGEVALDGTVRRTPGILPVVEMAHARGFRTVVLPKANESEARFFAETLELIPVQTLEQCVLFLEHKVSVDPIGPREPDKPHEPDFDISEIAGLESAKRAMEIVAAGGHNILLKGSPGTGKTLLGKALPSILPPLTTGEAMEITKIYSVAGIADNPDFVATHRPFRSPHHSASLVSVVGGGTNPKPGEVSLAHRGVLFLDEFPEFPRQILESLRQPLEEGTVVVSRAKQSVSFPARFILVAAMNPCPCGWYGDPRHECSCSMAQVAKYQQKISGPLMDRIDLSVSVPRIPLKDLDAPRNIGQSQAIKERVAKARAVQERRFSGQRIVSNAEMTTRHIREHCKLDTPAHALLEQAERSFVLSPRSLHRILRVSRTIADLAESPDIRQEHIAEALQYREEK